MLAVNNKDKTRMVTAEKIILRPFFGDSGRCRILRSAGRAEPTRQSQTHVWLGHLLIGRHDENSGIFAGPKVHFGIFWLKVNMIIQTSFAGPAIFLPSADRRTDSFATSELVSIGNQATFCFQHW